MIMSVAFSSEGGRVNTHVERQHLSMRMSVKRLTRKTNAFSKKYISHVASQALYFTYYNFVRPHSSIGTTPAIAAALDDEVHDFEWVVDLINARVPRQQRGAYRPRRSSQVESVPVL